MRLLLACLLATPLAAHAANDGPEGAIASVARATGMNHQFSTRCDADPDLLKRYKAKFEAEANTANARLPAGHAVDIIRRPRSTGSILKPLLYAAMLEDGLLTPRMLLADVPTHFEGFTPENFDRQYRGAVPADEALATSLNIPAVRMLRSYGVARFADLLRSSGMTTLTRPADDYGLTLILGGAEGNLWDIAGLYASLADIARQGAADPEPRFRELSAVLGEKLFGEGQGPT